MLTHEAGQAVYVSLDSLRQRIIDNMTRAGQHASGRTADTMRVDVQQNGTTIRGTLWGRPFFGTLETGSRPWSRADEYERVPYWFARIIRDWIDAKGLSLNEWAVAHKIIHGGSKLYREGGRDDIYSSEIPQTMTEIGKQMVALYDMEITEMIKLNGSNEKYNTK